jgi:hypothetical protein
MSTAITRRLQKRLEKAKAREAELVRQKREARVLITDQRAALSASADLMARGTAPLGDEDAWDGQITINRAITSRHPIP